MHKLSTGIAKPQNKEMSRLKTISVYVIKKELVLHKIMRKPSTGTAKLPTRKMSRRNTISEYVMKMVKV